MLAGVDAAAAVAQAMSSSTSAAISGGLDVPTATTENPVDNVLAAAPAPVATTENPVAKAFGTPQLDRLISFTKEHLKGSTRKGEKPNMATFKPFATDTVDNLSRAVGFEGDGTKTIRTTNKLKVKDPNDVNQAEFTTALKSKMTNIYDEGARKADPLKM